MSICQKNKSSKARRDKEEQTEDECSKPGKMQQMWRAYDASQSM